MSDNFWNDERVKDMIYQKFPIPERYFGSLQRAIDEYKKEELNKNKDWEIIDYRYISEGNEKQVISVRRISDGEVFSVGDNARHKELNYGAIEKFTVDSNNLMWVWINKTGHVLSSIEKAKQKLFTTEDGKDIFEGDEYWYANVKESSSPFPAKYNATRGGLYGESYSEKTFSIEQAAKEYIINNKPCLSYDDVMKVVGHEFTYPIIVKLKELVKQKINL